ncbi:MAG: hypothetical protein B7Z58_18870 [Acidiphilium sp. 37-64-53]|jgi:hypothetical protein|nr:MAG: hypothetical protein B7Z58_18870 [Acidiphilium sp. 37-64-53]
MVKKITFVFQLVIRGGYDTAGVVGVRHQLCRRFVYFYDKFVLTYDNQMTYPYVVFDLKYDTYDLGVRHGSGP